jgi:hypothetical protein
MMIGLNIIINFNKNNQNDIQKDLEKDMAFFNGK